MKGKLLTKLLGYQKEDLLRVQELDGRALVAWDMGLGKSVLSLMYAIKYVDKGPVVVVCPAGIKWNWDVETRKHLAKRCVMLDGLTPRELARDENRIYVVNYDILSSSIRSDRSWEGWVRALRRIKPKLVIGDEAHFLSNPKAKRTKAFKKLCKGVPHVLLLTGTPLTSKPAQLWPLLNILCPEEWPSFFTFAQDHCAPRRTFWGWQYNGATNLGKLHRQMTAKVMVRRRKADVLKDLPAKSRHVVMMTLENEKEVRNAHKDFARWLVRNGKHRKRALRAEKLTRWSHLRQLVAKHKLRSMRGWINDFLEGSNEKLILFGVHRSVVRGTQGNFKDVSVLVDGMTSKKDRAKAFTTFVKGEETRLLFGNIDAAGVGWSADGVSQVAFMELPWTPGQVEQGADRVHGLGRGQKGVRAQTWFLIGAGTIEEDLGAMLSRKQKIISQVIDGKSHDNDLNLMDLMEETLMEKWS